MMRALLCIFLFAFATAANAQESVSAYRARLGRAEVALRPDAPRGSVPGVLNALSKSTTVQRSDGQTQAIDGGEFGRLANRGALTKAEVASAHQAVKSRLQALDEWSRASFVAADAGGEDAQEIVRGLEASGQIRTGPSWAQLQWEQLKASIAAFFASLGRFNPNVPTGTGRVILWIFGIVGAILLAFVLWLILRAILNYRGTAKAKRKIEATGENADLLVYGTDELRSRAGRFASEGNFREALRHLYVALLLELDARGAWRYDPRRSNWEMIAQLRGAPRGETQALAAPMSELTRRFDRVRYGNADFDAQQWNDFERDATQLEKQLTS